MGGDSQKEYTHQIDKENVKDRFSLTLESIFLLIFVFLCFVCFFVLFFFLSILIFDCCGI